MSGIERYSCEAREGSARSVVKMREGDKFQAFVADVKSEIDAISDFPDRAESARVIQIGLTDFITSVAITGPTTRSELWDFANDIRTRMIRWGGIAIVEIRGFSTFEMQIELNPKALKQFGVSVSDIARAVGEGSVDLPTGSLDPPLESLLIRVTEERRNPRDMGNLIVRSSQKAARCVLVT